MKDLFKKVTTSILLSSIVAFIIGLILVAVPGMSLTAIGITVGIYAIVHGIMIIAMDFVVHNLYVPFYGIMSGVLSVLVGLVLIANPSVLATIFTLALGIWIVFSSINVISVSLTAKNKVPNWYWWLILGIVDLVAGVIVLFNPFASSLSIAVVGGIFIMIHSAITIADMIMIKKEANDVAKAFEASLKELKSGAEK